MSNSPNRMDHGAIEAARYGISRSPEWPETEKKHLEIQPDCVACGGKRNAGLQVHHIFPFHYCIALGRPDLELDQRNLITLCENEADHPGENHHLLIGHLDDFASSNLDVVIDAKKTFWGMSANQIKNNAAWQQKQKTRLKALDNMTQEEKNNFISEMNKRFPLITEQH